MSKIFYAHDPLQMAELDEEAERHAFAADAELAKLEARMLEDYDTAMRDGTADRLMQLKMRGQS
jgi:hypothetical protein